MHGATISEEFPATLANAGGIIAPASVASPHAGVVVQIEVTVTSLAKFGLELIFIICVLQLSVVRVDRVRRVSENELEAGAGVVVIEHLHLGIDGVLLGASS